MLQVDVRAHKGTFDLALALTVKPSEPLVVVGESGAGKTTFLELLAGIAEPSGGTIVVDGATWFDSTTPQQTVPAHHRPVGYVAQDATLFPHLSVVANVAFGLRASGVTKHEALVRGQQALRELGISDLAGRRTTQLSGGQQQRVTLARALCLEPRLLLMDEPLASLDVATKQSMRAEIRRVVNRLECITVYVTHDPLEALTIADQVAVIEDGKLTQVGDRVGLLRHPRSPYVGRFVGVNLFRGSAVRQLDSGIVQVTVDGGTLYVADAPAGSDIFLTIDPSDVTLSKQAPTGSARNVFEGKIEEMTPTLPAGDRVRVSINSAPPLVAEITRSAAQTLGLQIGAIVYGAVKATAITNYQ